MTPIEIGIGTVAVLMVLIYSGLHIAVVLIGTSFVAVWLLRGDPTLSFVLLRLSASEAIKGYVFGVVPLFVLMGLLVSISGVGQDAFFVADRALRRVKGGLGVATVGANAIFAAVTGVSIASLVVFAKVAVPEMLKFGYTVRFATGVVAGSSVLGMLIPPSLLLIVYGVLTDVSIGDLFLAGILPGLVLSLAYAAAIVWAAVFRPHWVGDLSERPPAPATRRFEATRRLAPILLLILSVMGGIYGGFFTPTEAGAVGAAVALVIALARRSLDRSRFWRIVVETGHVTASISAIIIGASMYSRMLAMTGIPNGISEILSGTGLGMWGALLIYLVILLVLGTILDSISIMLIMVPLALPVMQGFGVDLVWFGILTTIAVEIGILTPPLGLAVFVLKGALDDPSVRLGDIFIGAAPFALIMLGVLGLILAFPWIATGLL